MVTSLVYSCAALWCLMLGVLVWQCFIWPAVEAVSITRMMYAAGYHDGVVKRWWRWYKQFAFGGDAGLREISGAKPDAKRWRWEGVGKWRVW